MSFFFFLLLCFLCSSFVWRFWFGSALGVGFGVIGGVGRLGGWGLLGLEGIEGNGMLGKAGGKS